MTARSTLASILAGLIVDFLGAAPLPRLPAAPRVSGPFAHDNLAVFVVSGKGSDQRRFITLDEGLRAKTVTIRERGARPGQDGARVNELEIDNGSDDWLFLQAGDVVSGGKQDRTIAIDAAIPPRSGPRPIAAFCVEHGRWTPRASGMSFSASPAIAGSNAMKRNIQEHRDQQKVWAEVARLESKAAAMTTVTGQAPAALSSTGTYNAIVENPRIVANRADYVAALLPRVEKTRDAIGLVVAINGEITAADVYDSPALFHRLARKLLDSYAQEAVLARRPDANVLPMPPRESAEAFLQTAGSETVEKVTDSISKTTKHKDDAVVFEYRQDNVRGGAALLLHRNYVKN